MKLYTEEQLRYAIDIADDDFEQIGYDEIIDKLTPIELPSDEEIVEVAMVIYGFNAKEIKDVLEYKAFKRGARWVINKIQGGNK